MNNKTILKRLILETLRAELKARPLGLTFQVIEDSEGDENRGWRVDKLVAMLDGKEVGYLKMSWIPKERFKREYPTILHWMGLIGGRGSFDRRYSKWDMATISGRIKAMLDDQDYTGRSSQDPKLDRLSFEEQKALYKKLYSFYPKKQFVEFRNHWVDKPLVDFIRVAKIYQRQGIGIAMYEEGAKHLAKMGLRLYASTNQRPEAAAAWQWLQTNASEHVGIDAGRKYLSFL